MGKRVADAVHGTIRLSDLEVELMNSPSFQRIRGVKQLGLASLVFPGADYSRFSHCVGVCHVTGLLLDSLSHSGIEVSPEERKLYRAAGLLHDIGHYPFSHAAERAVKNYYAKTEIFQRKDASDPYSRPAETDVSHEGSTPGSLSVELPGSMGGGRSGDGIGGSLNHEQVGKLIITEDPRIRDVLLRGGVEPNAVVGIIRHEGPAQRFAKIVSSDLDADRIDYLLRTAHHTGLPYGNVDLPYLASQLTLDDDDKLCLDPRALRTGEHLLLARYFDYQQVSFHKTVTGLELMLQDVFDGLLEEGVLHFAAADIRGAIEDGRWSQFDDARAWEAMRTIVAESLGSEVLQQKTKALLERQAPKMLGSIEFFGERSKKTEFLLLERAVERAVDETSTSTGIDRALWWTWGRPTPFTAIGSKMPASVMLEPDPDDLEQFEQSVRIKTEAGGSIPIQQCPESVLSTLGDTALYALRVYALLPAGSDRSEVRAELTSRVPDVQWQ